VIAWGKTRPNIRTGGARRIGRYKTRFAAEAPGAAEDLKEFGRQLYASFLKLLKNKYIDII